MRRGEAALDRAVAALGLNGRGVVAWAPLPIAAVFDAHSIIDAPASSTRPVYPAWLAGSREMPGRRTERSQRFPCEMADARIRDITRRYPRPAKSSGRL